MFHFIKGSYDYSKINTYHELALKKITVTVMVSMVCQMPEVLNPIVPLHEK